MSQKLIVTISTIIGLIITGVITVISQNFTGLWVSITIPILGVVNEVINILLEYFGGKKNETS